VEFSRRKWGWYLTLLSYETFKVKLLYFKKDKHLSLQKHLHRNELWCFLSGKGFFIYDSESVDAKKEPVTKGEHRVVQKRYWHQYYAIKSTLVLEIQYGTVCSEVDIIRS